MTGKFWGELAHLNDVQEDVEGRASPENPTTNLSNPDEFLFDAFGAASSKSGRSVTVKSALGLTPVFNAIQLISETVAQLPLGLYRRTDKGSEIARDLPLNDIVSFSPYPEFTSFYWRQLQQARSLGWGNGYAHIERDVRGRPRGIRPLDESTRVERKAGKKIYVAQVNGRSVEIPHEDGIQIPAMGFDGLGGRSPIQMAREAIGLAIAAQEFGAEFFGNGAHWGSTLEIPDDYGSDNFKKMKQAVKQYQGKGYQGTLVTPGGAKLSPFSINPKDAQFIEGRNFNVLDVARLFNIPADMISYLEKSSFNNTTEMSIRYLRYTMSPWLVKWEQELNLKLLTREERQEYFFKFNTGGLLRGTQKERHESYRIGVMSGYLTRNEVRRWEDLNDIDGLDEPLTPLNFVAGPDPAAGRNERSNQFDSIRPVIHRCAEQVANFSQKLSSKQKTAEERTQAFADFLIRNCMPVAQTACNLSGEDPTQLVADLGDWCMSQRNITTQLISEKLIELAMGESDEW